MFRSTARIASVSAAGLAIAAGLATVGKGDRCVAQPQDQFANLPNTIRLTGTARDFRWYNVPGGHPDFEQYNTGHRVGIMQTELDADGKPVFKGQGKKVGTQYRDRQGRNINPALYDPARGDVAGTLSTVSGNVVTSAASVAQWFRDVPGVNISVPYSIDLVRQPGTNLYSFRSEDDPSTPQREGFFIMDGQGYNDVEPTYRHNYGFTFELSTTFTYRRGVGQVFTFIGDDDVYVFINGKLAIDVGGVHGAVEQTIDLDRFADLHGLVSGQRYPLKFFYCERHTTRSNCRIDTNLELVPAELPSMTALAD